MAGTKTSTQVLVQVSDDGVLSKPATQTTTWYKRVREVRKDPTVRLVRALARAPVVASGWSVEMKEGANEEAKTLIEAVMEPLRLFLLDTATAGCLDFGWQPYELVLEQDKKLGKTVISKLKPLLQDITSVRLDKKTGSFMGLRQAGEGGKNIDLKPEECLVLTYDREGDNYYGQGAIDCVINIQTAWDNAERGVDRYCRKIAGAHWVVHYPDGETMFNGAATSNAEIATSLLKTLEASGSIAVPKGVEGMVQDLNKDSTLWKIELLADSGGQAPFIERQRYLDILKVRAFEVPERAVLEGEFGTKAEAEVHADMALLAMDLRHQRIVQTLNWYIVNRLLQINFGDEAIGTVYIKSEPIVDTERSWWRDVYKLILANEAGFMPEFEALDIEALRDRVQMPTKATAPDSAGVVDDEESSAIHKETK